MTSEVLEKMVAELLLSQKLGKAEMMDKFSEIGALIEKNPVSSEGWLRTKEAAIALKSEGIHNARYLGELRRNGAFRIDKGEIRNVSRGERPTWEYNIPKCRKALQRYFKEINH